jgi:hypothetical protein
MVQDNKHTEKSKEFLEKQGEWVCKNCTSENDAEDMDCTECSFDRRFSNKELGTPSQSWKELRKLYKERIIHDVPENIPDFAVPHLRSDMERYMYKRARKMVDLCIQHRVWNREYDKPEILHLRLQDLDMGNVSASIRAARMIDYLEDIYWTASMHLCDVMDGKDELFGYMGLLLHSRYRGGNKEVLEEKFEKFKELPSTISVKGSSGNRYWLNVEQQFCSCPAFKHYTGPCKHLKKQESLKNKPGSSKEPGSSKK